MTIDAPPPLHPLRAPCEACSATTGIITETSGQDVVRCSGCQTYQYNAPRTETKRKVRSLATREGLTVSQRARLLETFDHACVSCGRRPPEVELQLDHLISRDVAHAHGFLDEVIDGPFNLAPMCPPCNSGKRFTSGDPLHLVYRCLLIQMKRAAS